jgi:thioredoxin 1
LRAINDKTFSAEIERADIAMVMFSAPWAGPCNLVRPAFEAVARRYGNQITFGEFNLDDNPMTPERLGVRQLPLFILFEKGKIVSIKAGAIPEQVLTDLCEKAIE